MNIRQKLAELRNLAREGVAVDTAEYVELEARARAEDQLAEYAAEGERTRAEERAAREREARRTQAATEARDLLTGTRARVIEAHNQLRQFLAEVDAAVDDYNTAVRDAARILESAGFVGWDKISYAPMPVDHPDFDATMHPIITDRGTYVCVDGTDHSRINAGILTLWAAQGIEGVTRGLSVWKADRNTYPIQAPLAELKKVA